MIFMCHETGSSPNTTFNAWGFLEYFLTLKRSSKENQKHIVHIDYENPIR